MNVIDTHQHHSPVEELPSALILSGPMTGLPDYNYDEFHRVAEILRHCGYYVINPADQIKSEGKDRWDYMAECFRRMEQAHNERPGSCGVALLKGHDHSTGSILERALAERYGWSCREWPYWILERHMRSQVPPSLIESNRREMFGEPNMEDERCA